MIKRNTNVIRTKKEVLKWYKEFLNTNISTKEMNIKYKTDVYYQFKKYSLLIPKKFRRHKNRKTISYYFESIKNEKEAYIIGFFLADGSVSKDKTLIKFHQKDKKILEKIRNYCLPEASITVDKENWVLNICSKEIGNNLKNVFNIDNRKSYSDFNIPIMNEEFQRHFIRGYFDADGSIYYDKKYLRWNICSITKNILLDIQNILLKFNIKSTINCEIRKNKSMINPQGTYFNNAKNMYRLKIGKKEDLIKIYHFMYENSTIFLERKYNIFKQYADIELTV